MGDGHMGPAPSAIPRSERRSLLRHGSLERTLPGDKAMALSMMCTTWQPIMLVQGRVCRRLVMPCRWSVYMRREFSQCGSFVVLGESGWGEAFKPSCPGASSSRLSSEPPEI